VIFVTEIALQYIELKLISLIRYLMYVLNIDIKRIVRKIHELAKDMDDIKIMGFCGTHKYVIME